ncbi:hypothetical protein [Brachyspira pilosicoli]|uniref:hypothetical protein n=1 Tax=Brachyspira pilosicoli TaxID=52584 RepID=UPI000E190787|nr:hypothetical protein [Brachyspira pilosicoli]SUW05078.1 Uncharacterised protein [Brachyspira pilosicoli]SUW09067.1 Uncharacterised protein [Brachyspira pilosicoli]
MREEIKAFEKTLIELGFTLNSFNQMYCYENNRKKPVNSYEINFSKNKNCYSLKKYIGNEYTLRLENKYLIYETFDHKNMIDYLIIMGNVIKSANSKVWKVIIIFHSSVLILKNSIMNTVKKFFEVFEQ